MISVNRSIAALALGAVMSAVPVVADQEDRPETAGHPMIGEAAPLFELDNVQGGQLSLEALRGQLVVIHFGTSW